MSLLDTKNQLIQAYEIVLKSSSTFQERRDAEAYCENLKLSGFLAFQLGVSLLDARNGHALHLRNLGVNFIEYSIKSDSLDNLNILRKQFWSLVFEEIGSFDPVNEKNLLKEKVSTCMAILACKLWLRPEDDPLQWNDFFEIGIIESVLKSQVVSGNEQIRRQEFALLTISQLINMIRSPSTENENLILSEDRRLQLHSGLEIVLPPFTEWLFINFPLAVNSNNLNFNVLNAAVSCFRSFCTWMGNLNLVGLQNFIQTCFIILSSSYINLILIYYIDNFLHILQTYIQILLKISHINLKIYHII